MWGSIDLSNKYNNKNKEWEYYNDYKGGDKAEAVWERNITIGVWPSWFVSMKMTEK